MVFAGPNGVGKTHINAAPITSARDPQHSHATWIVVEATSEKERSAWKKSVLDTRIPGDAQILRTQLQRNQRRNSYQSSFLNFDSDRAVRNVQQYNFGWDIGDPLTEEVGWDLTFGSLFSRYNDVRHSLFRMVEGQKREVAEQAFALQRAGATSMPSPSQTSSKTLRMLSGNCSLQRNLSRSTHATVNSVCVGKAWPVANSRKGVEA